jgi:hypothetical protein
MSYFKTAVILISFSSVFVLSSDLYSQSNVLNDFQVQQYERLAKISAINAVNDYDQFITLSKAYYKKTFFTNFSKDATHTNDILFSNNKFVENINIRDYYDVLNINEDYLSNLSITSNIFNVDCDVIEADIISYLSSDSLTYKFKSLTCLVYVNALKTISAIDSFGLNFHEEIPVEFIIEVFIDEYDRFTSKFVQISSSSDSNDFEYLVISNKLLDSHIAKETICEPYLVDFNESHSLFKFSGDQVIFEDSLALKDDFKIVKSQRKDHYEADVRPSEADRFYSHFQVASSIGSSVAGLIDSDYDIFDDGSFYRSLSIEGVGGLTNVPFLRMVLGFSYKILSSNLTSNGIYLEHNDVDPDGYSYIRQSTFLDLSETLDYKIFSFQIGASFNFGQKTTLTLSSAIPIQSLLSFNNQAAANHHGFYADLYGITIDEGYIYNFGNYSTSGFGVIDDFNLFNSKVKLSYNFPTIDIKSKAPKDMMFIAFFEFSRDVTSFSNKDVNGLEIDASNINSSSLLVKRSTFNYLGLGLSISIRDARKLLDCK